jgi:GTP-binding protein Era
MPEQDNIFDADYVTDRSEKFVVAEFIREKLMRHLTDELPYDLTVEIEQYELEGEMQRIAARIFVDKTSQKSIVIGNKGEMLKLIGTESRQSIEGFLHWVKKSNNKEDSLNARR